MVNKALGKMEVLRGFIQIPAKNRRELIGDMLTPCKTLINEETARLDNYGRLWSPWLKGRFPVGSQIQLSKTERGFQIEQVMNKSESVVLTNECKSKTELLGAINHRADHIRKLKKLDDTWVPKVILGEDVQTISFRELVKDVPSTNYATHGIYYYPAKFIPQVVRYAVSGYTKKGDLVFDPFAGSGTVGVEVAILERKSLLWDIDPILEYLMRVKLLRVKKEDWDSLKDNIRLMLEYDGKPFMPNWKNKLHWYDRAILECLGKMWGYIHYVLSDDYKLKPIIIFALLKASRKFSYGDDRVPKLFKSKMKSKYIKELLQGDWESYLRDFLLARAKDIFNRCLEFVRLVGEKEIVCKVEVGDALEMKVPQDIALIVTSPPYFQAQEYIRSTKLELYWLMYTDEQIRKFTKAEIPYNNPPHIEIHSQSFDLHRDRIKSKRQDLLWIYDRWFYSIINVLEKSFNALKKNGHMVTFIGPSTIAGMPVPIYKVIKEHFEKEGADHIVTFEDRIQTRRLFGNRLNPSPEGIPAEYLTILRKS